MDALQKIIYKFLVDIPNVMARELPRTFGSTLYVVSCQAAVRWPYYLMYSMVSLKI